MFKENHNHCKYVTCVLHDVFGSDSAENFSNLGFNLKLNMEGCVFASGVDLLWFALVLTVAPSCVARSSMK